VYTLFTVQRSYERSELEKAGSFPASPQKEILSQPSDGFYLFPKWYSTHCMEHSLAKYFLIFLFAFVATTIDGGIGMGYGTSLTTLLLSIGVGTAVASASVHIAEVFTALASGLSHFKMGNFDQKIFAFLAIPGVFGGVLGAWSAVQFENEPFIRPAIGFILLVLGILIIVKFMRKKEILDAEYDRPRVRHLMPLGFVAAFIDAIGGGGWGPIATPTLVLRNAHPQQVVGSVNFAEFFVAFAISVTFFFSLPPVELTIIIPMVVGGLLAAPLGAWLTKRIPHKTVGILVGGLIILLSMRTILTTLL